MDRIETNGTGLGRFLPWASAAVISSFLFFFGWQVNEQIEQSRRYQQLMVEEMQRLNESMERQRQEHRQDNKQQWQVIGENTRAVRELTVEMKRRGNGAGGFEP